MAYDLPKFESRITVPTGGWAMTVTDSGGSSTYTVPSGNPYLSDLLPSIASNLTGLGSLAGTYTATVDDNATAATGLVTLAATGGGNISVAWGSNALRDLLGFAGNLSGAASHTATAAPKCLFLSDVPIGDPMVPDGHNGLPISDGTFTASPSGTSRVMRYGSRRVNGWYWPRLSGRKTWASLETYDNESAESFFDFALFGGTPFRYHWDRSDDASYTTWRMVGPSAFPARPDIAGFVGGPSTEGAKLHWNLGPIDLIEHVT